MKNLILTIVSVIAINTLNAQQDFLASLEIPEQNRSNILNNGVQNKNSISFNYGEDNSALSESKIVKRLENDIMNYDIKKNKVYNNSEEAVYKISFKRKDSKAHVTFNNEGEILKSLEVYKNIKLPLELRLKISAMYPEYTIYSNKVKVLYKKGLGVNSYYKIVVHNVKYKKTLKFNKDYLPI